MKDTNKHTVHYERVRKLFTVHSFQPTSRVSNPHSRFKRAFDIIISILVICTVLSWLLPVLAILIKLNSPGPIFFKQKRIGLNGRPFTCIKLRTMILNRQANSQPAMANDPRITSLGRFLRLSCMDELPQFFNVLLGQMSIVGPRPHMIKDCNHFSEVIQNYHLRNQVRPGITGVAQVKGYRGQTASFYDMSHRYKWDIFYIRNFSFKLDMKIIRLTISSTVKTVYTKFLAPKREMEKIACQFEAPEFLN